MTRTLALSLYLSHSLALWRAAGVRICVRAICVRACLQVYLGYPREHLSSYFNHQFSSLARTRSRSRSHFLSPCTTVSFCRTINATYDFLTFPMSISIFLEHEHHTAFIQFLIDHPDGSIRRLRRSWLQQQQPAYTFFVVWVCARYNRAHHRETTYTSIRCNRKKKIK